jgi:excisionase family DNA binding protein
LTIGELRELVRGEIGALLSNQARPKLLYTTEQAAELCGVPSTWLASAARSGKVKCRRLGSYVRFTLDDLKELIELAEQRS